MTRCVDPTAVQCLSRLQQKGKPDVVDRIIELFVTESRNAITRIHTAVCDGDLQVVYKTAHSLKTSSLHVGALELSDCCVELEKAALKNNYVACVVNVDQVEDLIERSIAELHTNRLRAA